MPSPDPHAVIRVIGCDPGDQTGLCLLECTDKDPKIVEAIEVGLHTLTGQRALNEFMDRALARGPVHGLAMEVPRHPYLPDAQKSRGMSLKEAIAVSASISVGQGARRGEIRARAIDRDIPVLANVKSDLVKASVAHSRATKEQVAQAIRLRFGMKVDDHAADAIAVAYAALKRDYATLIGRASRRR